MTVDAGDVVLPATLDMPEEPVRGGVLVLHGAEAGQRSYFLYEHVARVLTTVGVAVLRFDRRPDPAGHDIPLAVQAADAMAAVRLLRRYAGMAPVGLWGFSQGAWAAPLAAADHPADVAFLLLVSSCGLGPAAQMRFGTAEQLRRAGFGPEDLRELAAVRLAVEAYQRGDSGRDEAQALVDRAADREWFPLVYLPRTLPAAPGTWTDMDFDPAPVFARVRCPVLAFYGETDEWMPIEDSIAAWRRSGSQVEIVRLPGSDHLPTLARGAELTSINPRYAGTMLRWLTERCLSLSRRVRQAWAGRTLRYHERARRVAVSRRDRRGTAS